MLPIKRNGNTIHKITQCKKKIIIKTGLQPINEKRNVNQLMKKYLFSNILHYF